MHNKLCNLKQSCKEANRSRVISHALRCFVEKGIEASTITDIAERSGLTERSVYRYFDTKADLVLETALLFWQQAMGHAVEPLRKKQFSSLSGLDQIRCVLHGYTNLFFTNRQEMVFVHEAEGFLNRCGKSQFLDNKPPAPYEDCVGPLAHAIRKGMEDGTVRTDLDMESMYYNTYDAMLGLIQKLAIGPQNDEQYNITARTRLDQFCELLVNAYRKNNSELGKEDE